MDEQPYFTGRQKQTPLAEIDPKGQPINPQSFLPLIALLGIGALIALSINWGRLARGNRTLPSLFIGLALFAGIFAGPILHNRDELDSTLTIAVSIGFGGAFLAYVVGLMIVQARDYQDYLKYPQFRKAARVSYAGTWAVIGLVVFILSLLGLVVGIVIVTNRPETIRTEYFTITRPGTWDEESNGAEEYCDGYPQGCIVHFENYTIESQVVFTITYLPQNGLSMEAIIDSQWAGLEANYPDLEPIRTHTQTIDGVSVTFQEFTTRAYYKDNSDSLENYHISRGYMALDGGLLEITYWAIGEDYFEKYTSEFEEILDSIELNETTG